MSALQDRRSYRTLDGMRAVGAFLVVMRHVPIFFGPVRVPESFLAVDLFYLVSGFVVAHAYGERLRSGASLWTFTKTRIIRLYPRPWPDRGHDRGHHRSGGVVAAL